MSIRHLFMTGIIGLSLVTNAFAKSEDWTGSFDVKATNNVTVNIKHDATSVTLGFITIGQCLNFDKGVTFNGIKFNKDVSLCVKDNVDKFTSEVSKIGTVLNKQVKLGPNYTIK